MKKIDKRLERSSKSVVSLRDLLRKVCTSPMSYIDNAEIINALKSQGALSKYSCESLSISASSINTLKRVSDEYIEGGFQAIDQLRKTALQCVENKNEKNNKSNKTTRAGLHKRVNELEDDLLTLEKVNYALLQTLAEAIEDIKSVTNIDDREVRRHRSSNAIKKVLSLVSINPPPFDKVNLDSNVVPIKEK